MGAVGTVRGGGEGKGEEGIMNSVLNNKCSRWTLRGYEQDKYRTTPAYALNDNKERRIARVKLRICPEARYKITCKLPTQPHSDKIRTLESAPTRTAFVPAWPLTACLGHRPSCSTAGRASRTPQHGKCRAAESVGTSRIS